MFKDLNKTDFGNRIISPYVGASLTKDLRVR